ncbi:hypothetical protein [Undibacterium macrobrachii]|uniref:Uncharacterized protein n=1 Tax=Undibacterium macrobrachii TaxID=1119058 RepID=A0ABQ2X6W8_9BURK|nr:hypothetical protein [Undibacterium macrobrachii]GGX01399.1 hypothetical protein GCM10011282_04150 [Undibacterium macrobrachii]
MTTVIPNPPANPVPYTPDFETQMTDWLGWLTENASKFGDVSEEMNAALNASLLGVTSSSTTSLTITAVGTSKSLTVAAGKGYAVGMLINVASTANPNNYMKLRITEFNSSTGALVGAVQGFGGSGTFANWSVFFDVADFQKITITTGEVVAAGNLLAEDDSGNSQSVAAITTAIIQAVTATSVCAVKLASNNVAVFWSVAGNNIYMVVVDRAGATVVAPIIVSSNNQSSGQVRAATLSNGNIVFVFAALTTGYSTFKIVSPTGAQVVAETVIEAANAETRPAVDALTGGGFAVVYAISAGTKYALYTNTGVVAKNPTATGTTATVALDVCEQPTSGGFIIVSLGTSSLARHYNGAGDYANDVAIPAVSGQKIAASGSTVASAYLASNRLSLSISAHNSTTTINGYNAGNNIQYITPTEPQNSGSALQMASLEVLGDGTYLGVFAPNSASSEYPRWVRFDVSGRVHDSGILFDELVTANSYGLINIIPSGQNGFSLVWRASNSNIKFAHIKSGNVIGISDGQDGTNTRYKSNGAVTLANTNRLNVGGSKVNFSRQGAKVVI